MGIGTGTRRKTEIGGGVDGEEDAGEKEKARTVLKLNDVEIQV